MYTRTSTSFGPAASKLGDSQAISLSLTKAPCTSCATLPAMKRT